MIVLLMIYTPASKGSQRSEINHFSRPTYLLHMFEDVPIPDKLQRYCVTDDMIRAIRGPFGTYRVFLRTILYRSSTRVLQ